MNSTQSTWILAIPSLLFVLFYIAALLFVIMKRSDQSQAKTFAMLGIGVLFFLQVFGLIFRAVLARYFTAGDFILYHGLYGILATVSHVLAMSLLIAAVFVGRSSDTQPPSQDKLTPIPSDNPYSPPVG